jgi:hypothetical protein
MSASLILDFTFPKSISSPFCIKLDFELERESIMIHRMVKKNDKMHKIHNIQLIDFWIVKINSDHPQVLAPIM